MFLLEEYSLVSTLSTMVLTVLVERIPPQVHATIVLTVLTNEWHVLVEEYSLVSTVSTMVACSCGGILFSKYSEHNGGMFTGENTCGAQFLLESILFSKYMSTMVACSCGGILFSKYSEHNGGMFLWRNTLYKYSEHNLLSKYTEQ